MTCEFCGKDPAVSVLVPAPSGEGQVISCIPCAVERGLYCERHHTAHRWFATRKGGHACKSCILDMVQEHIPQEEEIFDRIMTSLPPEEVERIDEWLSTTIGQRDETRVLDAISMEAKIHHRTFEDVLGEVISTKSANLIVPLAC